MSRSAIYLSNSSFTPTIGSPMALGTVVRRYGCNLVSDGSSVTLKGTGYYETEISATVTPTSAGTVTLTLYKDGTPVSGATASATTTDASQTVCLAISSIVREMCCCSNLTLVLSGAAANVNNIAFVVEKE